MAWSERRPDLIKIWKENMSPGTLTTPLQHFSHNRLIHGYDTLSLQFHRVLLGNCLLSVIISSPGHMTSTGTLSSLWNVTSRRNLWTHRHIWPHRKCDLIRKWNITGKCDLTRKSDFIGKWKNPEKSMDSSGNLTS